MANPLIPYTFVADDPAIADHVNENFETLRHFLATQVAHRDASQAFTEIPAGPNANPTSNNQLTRKLYVDQKAASVADEKVANRVRFGGNSTLLNGVLPANWTPIFHAGRNAGNTSASGNIAVPYSTPFPNGLFTVQITAVNHTSATLRGKPTLVEVGKERFVVSWSLPQWPRTAIANENVDFTWLAIGF